MLTLKKLLVVGALVLSCSAADAGPLRRIAGRLVRPTCQQAPLPPALQGRPLVQATANVVQAVAQVPSATAQAVGQLVLPTARGTTCQNGVCR